MKEISKFSLLLPLALFIGAVVQDLNILSGSVNPTSILPFRELFVVIALILSLPLVNKQKWASDRNVLRGLRSLFLLILFTYILLMYSGKRLEILQDNLVNGEKIYTHFASYIFVLAWAFFSSVFLLIILGTLRNLIFIKQQRGTARNFSLLMVFFIVYPLINFLQNLAIIKPIPFSREIFQAFTYVSLFILVLLMVINSFRVSWINYLNKKQKLACFWGGLILVPLDLLFFIRFHDLNPVKVFSAVLGDFVDSGIIFLTIYLSVAFLALIAHLPTARLYDRKMHQISSLHHLSRAVSSEFELDKLVKTIVRLAAEVTEADFSWLELIDTKTQMLTLVSAKNLKEYEKNTREPSFNDLLSDWLKSHREPFLENQVANNNRSAGLLQWKRDIGSILAVPLVTQEKVVGFLYAGKRLEFGFEQDDSDMLRAFGQQAVIAVENARLVEESIVKERLEQELRIAHEAQMKLLPKEMPNIEGIELDAVSVTANEVGGDYYDFYQLGKGKIGVVIGDVSGKGPSAAFYMAEVKGIMEALAVQDRPPKEILISANETLYKNIDREVFVSLIYGVLDPNKKTFTFCRAGHCPILFSTQKAETCEQLEPEGIGLGLDNGSIFEESLEQRKIALKAGHSLLFYTDGASEARNRSGEEFGEERLMMSFASVKDKSPAEIKKKIIHDIYTFVDGADATDDLTFVVIKAV